MRSVQKTKVRIFFVWNEKFVNCIATMNLSEKFRRSVGKLMKYISLEAQFCENQTKNITNKNLQNFWKIFGEFSVSYRQTSSKS